MTRFDGRVLVVSPRPPRFDGKGDQRRAATIVESLQGAGSVETISWVRPSTAGMLVDILRKPGTWSRVARRASRQPLHVAVVQGLAPSSLSTVHRETRLVVFVTDRACPDRLPENCVIDFVDDLAGSADRRAAMSRPPIAWFWRRESRLTRLLDADLLGEATVTVAVSKSDAEGIGPSVRAVPLAAGDSGDVGPPGDRFAFFGNLAYAPNLDAALWIVRELVPAARDAGLPSTRFLIAGRRPPRRLRRLCDREDVELHADVSSIWPVIAEARVVLAPMAFGGGVQNKVLDAIKVGRPCLLTPLANRGLDLVDGESALLRRREATEFVSALKALDADAALWERLAEGAANHALQHDKAVVTQTWRDLFSELGSPRADR